MNKKNTLYVILGINDKAPPEDIASAYRMHMTRLRYAGDHDSRNERKLIRHAFEVLSDPEQREKYDQSLRAEATLSNTVIYYSSETRHGNHRTLWLIAVFVLAIAVYLAYPHYFFHHANADTVQAPESARAGRKVSTENGNHFVPAAGRAGQYSY